MIQVSQKLVQVFINSSSEFNVMYPDFVKILCLQVCNTKFVAQKIDSWKLDTFSMIIASFSGKNKKRRSYFFKKTFLLTSISMDIIQEMPFFTLSHVEIDFVDCHIH